MTTSTRRSLFVMSLTALTACVQVPGSNTPQDGEAPKPGSAAPSHPPKLLIKFNPDYIARIMAEKAKPANSARILELANDNEPSIFAIVGHGHNVAFDSAGFELSYIAPPAPDGSADVMSEKINVRFDGAKSGLKGSGLLPNSSATHVMRKARFRADVPAFGAVRYEDVYPNIDLYYLDTNDQFTFMFVVQPGGNPDVIRITVEGDDGTVINSDGALIVSKRGKAMSISAPFTYQETASGKKVVDSEFAQASGGLSLTDKNSFQFGIGGYADDNALIIDPTVDFVSMLGNGNNTRLATSGDGNDIFVAGPSADFAPNAGVFYVARHDGKTGVLLNQTLLFGGRGDMVRDMHAQNGKLYLTGYASADLLDLSKTSPPPVQAQRSGATDAFVLVLDGINLTPTYGTYFGGTQRDYGVGIRAGADGSIYFAGYTDSANFPLRQTVPANFDAFSARIKPAAGGLADVVFASTMGGSSVENINGVSLDADGNFYMVGRTSSPDLPRVYPLPLNYQPTSAGFNPFLWKVAPTGGSLFSSYAHANDVSTGSYASSMDVSSDGNIIAFGGGVMGPGNQMRGYMMKVARATPSDPYEAIYTHSPVGTGTVVHAVSLDSAGNVYAAGESGEDFAVTSQGDDISGISAFLYVLKDTNSVPDVAFSKRFGGQGTDRASAVVVDRKSHHILIAGSTSSASFSGPSGGTLITGTNGTERGFLMRMSAVIAPEVITDPGEGPGEDPDPAPENRAPIANITRTGSAVIRAAKLSIMPNAINLDTAGDWILAFVKKDNAALAKITLDARASTDADGDQLSFRMILSGPGGSSETHDPLREYNLQPGSYNVTLTVCDPDDACATTTDAFTVSRMDFSKVNPQDLKLNGVAADWLIYLGGDITAKFSKNLFRPTVSPGQNVPVILSGALEGIDHIKIIDN